MGRDEPRWVCCWGRQRFPCSISGEGARKWGEFGAGCLLLLSTRSAVPCQGSGATLCESPGKGCGLWAVAGDGGFALPRGSWDSVGLSPHCSGPPQPPVSPHQWLMDNCNWISKLQHLRLDSISLFSDQTTP